jgi:alkaline phosphatase D
MIRIHPSYQILAGHRKPKIGDDKTETNRQYGCMKKNYMYILFSGLLCGATPTQGPAAEGGNKAGNVVGPLVGTTTSTTTTLWLYTPQDLPYELIYKTDTPDAKPARVSFKTIPKPAAKLQGQPQKATIQGLRPSTLYSYVLAEDGKTIPDLSGTFKTAPPPAKPAHFRIGLSSCMDIDFSAKAWTIFREQKPDLHLTLGDTHYADSTDPNKQWPRHLAYRSVPEFAAVIRNIPTYAMWDDHDYGPNDSDGTAKGKEQSLESWTHVWANPSSGSAETPGAFFKFSWGEVDFFMVDGRYHRTPNQQPDDENKRMLGDAQFEWLAKGLKQSAAKFKVIASGSTLNHSSKDGWKIFTFSRHRLIDTIRENKITGVLYFAGDIHRSLVWENRESRRLGYPLIEVISSGVGRNNKRPNSFATVDFDTTKVDPTVQVRILLEDGTLEDDQTWALSQLQFKDTPDINQTEKGNTHDKQTP